MNANIQLTWIDQDISRINPESRITPESRVNPENRFNTESRIDPGSRVNPENWFNPEIGINLDSRINIRFESILWLDQLSRLHWHNQQKKLNQHDQRKFVIKIPKWLDPTKMLVESNPGSRINPRSRINPEGQFNHDSRINLESQMNCLIRINSPILPTFKIPLKLSSGRRFSRQRYNYYVTYTFYVDPNLQPSGEIILRQQDNLYAAYDLLQRSELTHQRRNFYIV